MISLRDIKYRLQSIENIHKITQAMKMISTVKFKKAQQNLLKSRSYCDNLKKIIDNIVFSDAEKKTK
jgi:F-type H+-transporting ATPase subunit gamma